MAPIGTMQQALLGAITTIAPKEASILVVLVVPSDTTGLNTHVAWSGDKAKIALAVIEWMRAQGFGG
jgi:hypothetical protein